MTKADFVKGATRAFHKVGFVLKKHSPEILVTAGVIGTVASTVLACKATLKATEIVENTKKEIETVNSVANDPTFVEVYSEQDHKKDLAIVYAKSGLEFAKLYGPSVLLGAASIGMILTSHKILSTRNAAVVAAYATLDKSFKEYRGRVVDRFGKELDRELKYNIKAETIEEKVVDEKGKEKTVEREVQVVDPTMTSDYARFYDDGCTGWSKDPEANLMFLKAQQSFANKKLQAQGYLFLNDVYDMLGIPRSKAGQVVGWVYDERDLERDNFVDFGIYDLYNAQKRDFVNGKERTILLDFNVDGVIADILA